MNPKLKKVAIFAGALFLAGAAGQAGPANARGNPGRLLEVSFAGNPASPRSPGSEGLSQPAYAAFPRSDDAIEGRVPTNPYSDQYYNFGSDERAVRLYPLESGRSLGGAASRPASTQGGTAPGRSQELSEASKPGLPEPGNWAMLLAGLLGVGAIARRRMPA